MRVILWDFDGTLGYRSSGAWTASLWEVLQAEEPQSTVTQEQLRPFMQSGFPWHQPEKPHTHIQTADAWWQSIQPVLTAAYIGVGLSPSRAQVLTRKFRATYLTLDRWRVYEDVIPVLLGLTAAGWTHCILSNHVPELMDIVNHLGLSPYFHRIFNSAETGYEKPHPRAFLHALEALPGLDKVWMVGDSLSADISGARDVDIPAILVRRHHPDAPKFAETLYEVAAMLSSENREKI